VTADQTPQQHQPYRVTVVRQPHGWEVREERDREVVRTTLYTDWHRVERAVQVLDLRYSTSR